MKKYVVRVLAVVVIVGCGLAAFLSITITPSSEILATVNGEQITMREYMNRYFKYLTASSIHDNLATRRIVMHDMINEHLMRRDAHARGWDRGPEYDHLVEDATLQVLLDTYRHRAIMDTLTVSEDEIKRAFARRQIRMNVRHLYAKTEEDAWKLKHLLEQGETFESLAPRVFQDPLLASNGGAIGSITLGDTDPAFEDAAYALPVGAISDPVKTAHGYSIIRVDKRVQNPLADEYDYNNARSNLARILRGNKLMQEGQGIATALVDKRQVNFNEPLLEMLYGRWQKSDVSLPVEHWGDSIGAARIDPSEVVLRNGTTIWTMEDFLYKLSFTTPRQRSLVKTPDDMREFIIGMMTRDILVHRARESGMAEEPQIRGAIRERVNYFLMDKWRSAAQDSVAYQETPPAGLSDAALAVWNRRHVLQENKLREIFDRKSEIYRYPDEVHVREIFVLTQARALDVMKQFLAGKDFSSLARTYSKRVWAAVKGGDMGFHTEEEYGALGKQIFAAKQGSVIGPAPVDSGFSIVQVLDKRPGREKTFDEARQDVINSLLPIWKNIAFANALGRLEHQSTIDYDSSKLESISYIDPMLLVHEEGQQGE